MKEVKARYRFDLLRQRLSAPYVRSCPSRPLSDQKSDSVLCGSSEMFVKGQKQNCT